LRQKRVLSQPWVLSQPRLLNQWRLSNWERRLSGWPLRHNGARARRGHLGHFRSFMIEPEISLKMFRRGQSEG
jgi:hypothetical protein